MTLYIGLDVHSKQTVYCCQDEAGNVLATGRVPTAADGFGLMLDQCGAPADTPIALETGNQAAWVYRVLEGYAMAPVVIEAGEVRAKARRKKQKTDERDAFEICDGLRRQIYTKIVWIASAEVQTLREILSRRRAFVKICTSQVNSAKFILRSNGFQTASVRLDTEGGWQAMLTEPTYALLAEFLTMHARIWKQARETVGTLDAMLDEAMEPFEDTSELLQTVPGVGPITAAAFIAGIGDVSRFASSAHVASYLGLVPSTYDSGDRQRHGTITKEGNPTLRAYLCEAAHQARRIGNPLNPYYRTLTPKKGLKRAIVAIAHRLARILYQIWKTGNAFDLSKLNVRFEDKKVSKHYLYHLEKT